MKRHPVYRLMDGQIMCQERPGGRWTAVDKTTVDQMLEIFAGVRPETIRSSAALPVAKALDG